MPQLVRVPIYVDDVNRAVAVNRNGWRQTALGDIVGRGGGPRVGFTVPLACSTFQSAYKPNFCFL